MADDSDVAWYLRGNYAPVTEEVTAVDLPVEGAIPPELRGVYMRNGPNPRSGESPHWFTGDGMLHGVRLHDGKAQWYRNRWVRTRTLVDGVPFVDEYGNVDHSAGVANTNVVQHASRVFALVESSFPTEMTRELDTVGPCDFGGKLTTSFTAHPKPCPRTGELHFFGYRFMAPFLTYHRLDAQGRLVQSEVIEVRGPTMVHDFAITDRHVIFMDLPIVFDLEWAMEGRRFPYHWSDDYGARLGVMPRGGGNADVRWFEIAPCYVFHPLNAYEVGPLNLEGAASSATEAGAAASAPRGGDEAAPSTSSAGRIVMEVARYPELWRGDPYGFAAAFLHRWTIDFAAGRVAEERLDDLAVEFPRLDDRRTGLRHRYGYAVANAIDPPEEHEYLIKYDLHTGARATHDFGPGRTPSEGVFVPSSDRAGEDEGYVLQFVYDAARNRSDFVVLDASNLAARPVAVVRLPQRVPYGFHGNWIPDSV